MSRLSNAIISIFRKGEKRISSEQFEQAVNQVLLSDTVADAVKKNIITPEGGAREREHRHASADSKHLQRRQGKCFCFYRLIFLYLLKLITLTE